MASNGGLGSFLYDKHSFFYRGNTIPANKFKIMHIHAARIYKMTTLVTVLVSVFAIVAFITAVGISDTSAQERVEIESSL